MGGVNEMGGNNEHSLDFLKDDEALQEKLSLTDSEGGNKGLEDFQDYQPNIALVSAAVEDAMDTLGLTK